MFIEVFTAIRRYDSRRPFPPWLHRIAVRRSLDELRKSQRTTNRYVPIDDTDDLPSVDPSPDDEAIESELRAAIWAAVGTLSPEQAAVLILRYYHDFSEAEMAIALGCPRGTVKSRLNYARAHLREILEARGSPLTDPRLSEPEIHRNGGTASQAACASISERDEVDPC